MTSPGEAVPWTGKCQHCPARYVTRWELEEHERGCTRRPGEAVRHSRWDLRSVEVGDPAAQRRVLANGWEPFAVAEGRVWFRLWVPEFEEGRGA